MIGTVRDLDGAPPVEGVALLPLDLASDDSIEALGGLVRDPIDVLVNNVGVSALEPGSSREEEPPERLTREEFRHILDINVVGTFLVTRTLLPRLRRGRRKLIVNVSSNMGSIGDTDSGGRYGYRCSKAALNMLTRCLALDLRPDGISCVAYHPGWVATDMGGAGAPVSPEAAADAFCDFLENIQTSDTGGFFDESSATLNW